MTFPRGSLLSREAHETMSESRRLLEAGVPPILQLDEAPITEGEARWTEFFVGGAWTWPAARFPVEALEVE